MRVLVLDNYDSFTYNLVQYLGELGAEVHTVRNDRASVDELLDGGYRALRRLARPVHARQGRDHARADPAHARGGRARRSASASAIRRSRRRSAGACGCNPPVHGKATTIEHDGRTIFSGLSSPLTVGRYHSLVVDPQLPDCLEESARGGGVVMGVRHRELPAEGVQFHPESVLTDEGKELLANFLGER